ncbi:unnamed protein product, partial [marine sediment metagenome]
DVKEFTPIKEVEVAKVEAEVKEALRDEKVLGITTLVTSAGTSTKGSLMLTLTGSLLGVVSFFGVFFLSLNSPSCLTGSFVFTSDII